MFSARRFRHDRMSASLVARKDDELAALLQAAPAGAVGMGGGSSVLDVDGVPVFAKQIPITDRELGTGAGRRGTSLPGALRLPTEGARGRRRAQPALADPQR